MTTSCKQDGNGSQLAALPTPAGTSRRLDSQQAESSRTLSTWVSSSVTQPTKPHHRRQLQPHRALIFEHVYLPWSSPKCPSENPHTQTTREPTPTPTRQPRAGPRASEMQRRRRQRQQLLTQLPHPPTSSNPRTQLSPERRKIPKLSQRVERHPGSPPELRPGPAARGPRWRRAPSRVLLRLGLGKIASTG